MNHQQQIKSPTLDKKSIYYSILDDSKKHPNETVAATVFNQKHSNPIPPNWGDDLTSEQVNIEYHYILLKESTLQPYQQAIIKRKYFKQSKVLSNEPNS